MSQMSFRGELLVRPHLRPTPRDLPCGPDRALYIEKNADQPGYSVYGTYPVDLAADWPHQGEA